jgi:hypothetical protein
MSRPKKGAISKKAAVEHFLAQGLQNKDVVQAVKKSYRLTVTPTYVAVIKSHRKKALNGSAPKTQLLRNAESSDLSAITAAIQFIKAAGSVEAAKQALATVEQIRQLA